MTIATGPPDDELAAVSELAASLELGTTTSDGFLVSGFTDDDYRRLISSGSVLDTIYNNGKLVAFALTCQVRALSEASWIRHFVGDAHDDLYVQQVAVSTSDRRRGLAAALYEVVMKQIEAEARLYASVVLDPFNGPSVKFHERMGFTLEHVETPADGMTRGLYCFQHQVAGS